MDVQNVLKKIAFLSEGPKKELLFDSENMRIVLFNLKKGQEIPSHTTTSEVLMYLVEGKGRFIVGDNTEDVEKGSFIVCKKKEAHGMIADDNMTVLAVIAPRPE